MEQLLIGRAETATPDATPSSASCTSSAAGPRRWAVDADLAADPLGFYLASCSARTIIYKGMLKPDQLAAYFPDLSDPDMESALALVHSRYSTNTFPQWALAQPFHLLAHNGEINTLHGNVHWLKARQPQMAQRPARRRPGQATAPARVRRPERLGHARPGAGAARRSRAGACRTRS